MLWVNIVLEHIESIKFFSSENKWCILELIVLVKIFFGRRFFDNNFIVSTMTFNIESFTIYFFDFLQSRLYISIQIIFSFYLILKLFEFSFIFFIVLFCHLKYFKFFFHLSLSSFKS
jgi:hypothetical protein